MSAPAATDRSIASTVFDGPRPSPPAWAITYGGLDTTQVLAGHWIELVGPLLQAPSTAVIETH